MVLYVTEQEMLDRYTDGLNKSASRTSEIIRAQENEKPTLFVEFLNGMKVAAGSAHQLAHSRPDQSPEWLKIRDLLENVIEVGKEAPLMTTKQNGHWLNIKKYLEQLVVKGKKIAAARGMSRTDVLFEMDIRAKNAAVEVPSANG